MVPNIVDDIDASPCLCGLLLSDVDIAIPDVPTPASLANIPFDTPSLIV